MKILVTASGRYGSTQEIAESIGEIIANHGHDVSVIPSSEVETVDGFEVVMLGGAVYAGQWLRDGRELIKRVGDNLADLPLYIFSSGPIGESMKKEPPPLMIEILEPLRARDHAIFGGKLDRTHLFIGDKAIAQSLSAEDGDYRDWDEITAWAEKVTADLGD